MLGKCRLTLYRLINKTTRKKNLAKHEKKKRKILLLINTTKRNIIQSFYSHYTFSLYSHSSYTEEQRRLSSNVDLKVSAKGKRLTANRVGLTSVGKALVC